MKGSHRWLVYALVLLASATPALAQTFHGGLRGAVREAGGVVPGVTVTLTNEATNASRTVQTNHLGEYAFVNVDPGDYTLKVSMQGFKSVENKGVHIGTQQFLTLDFTLEVGNLQEAITVEGATPLETSNASVSSTLDNKTLETLPTAGRNPFFLATITPGVTHTGDPQFVRQQDQTNSSLLSLGGGPRRGNNYTLDGVSIVDIRNRATVIPSIEAVEEVKVQVTTYDAEMGRTGGGVFNMTGKSGANAWHGSLLGQNRPAKTRSLSYFARKACELGAGSCEKPDTYFYLYAGSLGLIDNISVLAVRDGSFNPLPFGSQLQSDTKLWAPEMYVQDVWRIKPSLTLTLGVSYGWQTAPVERLGRQTIQIDAGTGNPITAQQFLKARKDAAANGQIFNPTFGFVPINSAHRGVFNVDYGDIAPRIAFAWTPPYKSGLGGSLFGSGKTVIRTGFAIIYDRQNTVQSVIIPALGVGFAQTLNLPGPPCNSTGAGGTGCNAASTNPALGVFRVGQDGSMPVPTVPAQSNPIVPVVTVRSNGSIVTPEVFSFQDDPSIKVGRNYAADLSVQREFPGNFLLEVAYSGRLGRKLPQSMSLGQSPINFKDPASGQTFAQAFDAVATAVRTGAAIPTEAWFENNIPTQFCVSGSNPIACSKWIAGVQSSNFINGGVSSIFSTIDGRRMLAGLPTFNNYLAQGIFFRSSTGEANYHALLVTLDKRTSHGLALTANYTFSHSLDQIGAIQNAANLMPNSFDLSAEYGPSGFDFRHIFNGKWVYDIPMKSSNPFLKRVLRGWFNSGIFTAISGQPLTATEGSQVWGGTLSLGFNTGKVPTGDPGSFHDGVHTGVTGSGGVGTNSDPANKGSGLNLFADPFAVSNDFRPVLLATDGRSGRSRPFRGLGHWNLDTSFGKNTAITERFHAVFTADFFNIFNHPIFCDPGQTNGNGLSTCGGSLSLASGLQNFGVISSQFIPANRTSGSRWIQLSIRFEF